MGSLFFFFFCVCSQLSIWQHNAKLRNPAPECVHQSVVVKQADGEESRRSCVFTLAGACNRTSQNRCKSVNAPPLLMPACFYAPPPPSTLHPPTPSPTSPPPDSEPATIPPSSKLDSPLASHSPHPHIHTCIIMSVDQTHRETYRQTHRRTFSDKLLKRWIHMKRNRTPVFSEEDALPLVSPGVDSSGGNRRILL